jgi:hypothetical protein
MVAVTDMKGPQKITKIQLSVTEQDEPSVFGIVTSDPDYKLSLKLNKKLTINLKGSDPLEADSKKNEKLYFSKFSDLSDAPDSVFHLISNRSGKNFFLRDLKNIDYILVLYDPGSNYKIEQITAILKEIETITAVFNIDRKGLKNKSLLYLI